MAESVRSPFDYREPPTLDSDGDGSKPPPPRGSVAAAGSPGSIVGLERYSGISAVLTVSRSGCVVLCACSAEVNPRPLIRIALVL